VQKWLIPTIRARNALKVVGNKMPVSARQNLHFGDM